MSKEEVFQVPDRVRQGSHVPSEEAYQTLRKESLQENESFWRKQALERVTWFRQFDKVSSGGFEDGDIAWFLNGQLNVSYNCVDRHVDAGAGDRVAIIWEGDEPGDTRRITYAELQREVCRFANVLLSLGIRKGDTVAIYMPMVPEAAYAMLACARIGAPHSVVFAGFSAESLRDRILDASSKLIITADQGLRGGRVIPLKQTADDAAAACPCVEHILVHRRTGAADVPPMHPGRDVWLHEAMATQRAYCPPVHLDSEDTLFLLYTSGSTGKPKGLLHTQAGYLTYVATTHHYSFDLRPGDVYACVADVGWITGHSYIVYGPLCNGATTLMFESTPLYPGPDRYWDLVARHKVTIFYTAPTAIRALMKYGEEPVLKHDRSSLRVLGTVGEPINPEAWRWYFNVIGDKRCAITDTFWQTESGGHLLLTLPGANAMKPGAAGRTFFGIDARVLDPESGKELDGPAVGVLALKRPWPGIGRTVHGDHHRYLTTYMHAYHGYYFTGDGVERDSDGYLWIRGRVDDVINTSGHRLGTAEVESALVLHPACTEAAVVGIEDEVKGQALFCYVSLRAGIDWSDDLAAELRNQVRTQIGGFAVPKMLVPAPGLPKTRSGKIMRRVLRKIASHQQDQLGDITTMADSSVVAALIEAVAKYAPDTGCSLKW